MIIIPCQQGSEDWFSEKLGKPSASNASKIITNDGKPSKQREGYLYELAAEIITGQRVEGYQNENMLTGQEREEESRNAYSFMTGIEVEQVGVIYKDEARNFLCSPDGINRAFNCGLEMKNVLPKTQVKYLLDNVLPSDYFGQVQFSLYVTGFQTWDFFSYCPGLRPLLIPVTPDEKFLKALRVELELFCSKLEEVVAKIK